MHQIVLWLNMVAFATVTASAGLLFLAYTRQPRVWLLSFIYYTAAYAAWLLFGTYVYFQMTFLPQAPEVLGLVFTWVRLLVSFVVLVTGSLFYLRVSSDPWNRKLLWVPAGASLVIALFAAGFLGFNILWMASVSTIVFNLFFCALSGAALRFARKSRDSRHRLVPFLAFSMVAYGLLTIASVLVSLVFVEVQGIPVNVLVSGIFTVTWGLFAAGLAMRWIIVPAAGAGGQEAIAVVSADFSISAREREILASLLTGKTSKEIGGQLFISQRTVETHLQNIFRKCGVSNRVELVNLVNRYSHPSA